MCWKTQLFECHQREKLKNFYDFEKNSKMKREKIVQWKILHFLDCTTISKIFTKSKRIFA